MGIPRGQTNLVIKYHLQEKGSQYVNSTARDLSPIPFDMASKGQLKDMRRDDLIVPYAEPEKDKESNDMQSTMASTLPMAAMFTRNKLIGWTAVMFSIQGWLAETPDQKANASTPGYFSVGMALLSLGVAYMPLFLPPQSAKAGASTGTQAPPPVPT